MHDMVTQFVYTVSRKLLFYSVICIKKIKKIYTHVLQFLRCTKLVDLFSVTLFLIIVSDV